MNRSRDSWLVGDKRVAGWILECPNCAAWTIDKSTQADNAGAARHYEAKALVAVLGGGAL